jgi:hypothetical protein
MKKLIATALTATILLTSSAMILADAGKKGAQLPPPEALEKIHVNLDNGAQEIENRDVKRAEIQKKLEGQKALIEQKKASFVSKNAEFAEFRKSLFLKREEMLALKLVSVQLRTQNIKLRGDLRSSLEKMKADGIVLSDETKLALDTTLAQIKEISTKIKDTKGQIHEILKNNREFIKAKDYVSMQTAFDEIFAIEQFRNDSLTQINTLLQEAMKLLVTVA